MKKRATVSRPKLTRYGKYVEKRKTNVKKEGNNKESSYKGRLQERKT